MFDDYDKYGDAFTDESNDVDYLELYDMYKEEREQEEYYFLLN